MALSHDTPLIDALDDLGPRAFNTLRRHGIRTIGQLRSLTEDDLWEMRGIGPKLTEAIEHALDEAGESLSEPTPSTSSDDDTDALLDVVFWIAQASHGRRVLHRAERGPLDSGGHRRPRPDRMQSHCGYIPSLIAWHKQGRARPLRYVEDMPDGVDVCPHCDTGVEPTATHEAKIVTSKVCATCGQRWPCQWASGVDGD